MAATALSSAARRFRHFACWSALTWAAGGSAAQTTDLVFRGVVRVGEEVFVSVQRGETAARWIRLGGRIEDDVLAAYDPATELLEVVRPDGTRHAVPLATAATGRGDRQQGRAVRMEGQPAPTGRAIPPEPLKILETFPSSDAQRESSPLDWEFIRSPENPMRRLPIIPGDESLDWISRPEVEKRAFIELYRQHGWKISVIASNHGVSLTYKRIKK